MRWSWIVAVLFSIDAQFTSDENLKLYDILKPSDTARLFDTLQFSVEEQYASSNLAFDVSTLYNYAEKPISIQKLNKKYSDVLYEGDMAISYDQLELIVNATVENRSERKKFLKNKLSQPHDLHKRNRRQAYVDEMYPSTIWTSGVPFVFHSSLNALAKSTILQAIHFWYRETCIDFTPRTYQPEYLLFLGNDEGCWSTVGKDAAQGRQVVSIGEGCEHFGVTSHELAHALGIFHEQSRYDRDKYVTFNPRTVNRTLLFNFAKISPRQLSTYDLPYDVGSVMHYAPTEFSNSPSIPALTANDANLQQTMGNLEGPSFLDVQIMNKHYKCQDRCKTQAACQNGGFTNSRKCSVCKCPSGFGGPLCETIAPSFSKACGGILQAQETTRRFDISIKQTGGVIRDKVCVYHIKAPEGKKIVIDILNVKAACIEGCWQDGLEMKMRKDVRMVGYRFCCAESAKRRAVSDTNLVPFMVYSKSDTVTISFQYTSVDANARFDDENAVESSEILEKTRDDPNGVRSSVSLPMPSLLGILSRPRV